MGQQLKDSEYATLVELLASALKDLTGGPTGPTTDGGRTPPTTDAKSHFLSSPPRPLRRRHSVDSPSLPHATDDVRVETGAGLFPLLDANLRLIARILRCQCPPALPSTFVRSTPPLFPQRASQSPPPQIVEEFAPDAGSSGKKVVDNKSASTFLRLPPELQRRILREARTHSEDASAWLSPAKTETDGTSSDPNAPRDNGSTARRRTTAAANNNTNLLATPVQNSTGIVYNLPPSQDPYPVDMPPFPSLYPHQQHPYLPLTTTPANPPRPKGGRRGAQEYAHWVTLVCKDLAEVARRTAWETVHVRTRKQVRTLVALWTGTFDEYDDPSQAKGVGKGKAGRGGVGEGRDGGETRAARSFVLGPNDAWVLEDISPMSSVASFESYGPSHAHEVAVVAEEQGASSATTVELADDIGGDSKTRRNQLLTAGLAVLKMKSVPHSSSSTILALTSVMQRRGAGGDGRSGQGQGGPSALDPAPTPSSRDVLAIPPLRSRPGRVARRAPIDASCCRRRRIAPVAEAVRARPKPQGAHAMHQPGQRRASVQHGRLDRTRDRVGGHRGRGPRRSLRSQGFAIADPQVGGSWPSFRLDCADEGAGPGSTLATSKSCCRVWTA